MIRREWRETSIFFVALLASSRGRNVMTDVVIQNSRGYYFLDLDCFARNDGVVI